MDSSSRRPQRVPNEGSGPKAEGGRRSTPAPYAAGYRYRKAGVRSPAVAEARHGGGTERQPQLQLQTRTAGIGTVRGHLRSFGIVIPTGARHVVPRADSDLRAADPFELFQHALIDLPVEIEELPAEAEHLRSELEYLVRSIRKPARSCPIPTSAQAQRPGTLPSCKPSPAPHRLPPRSRPHHLHTATAVATSHHAIVPA